MKKANTLYNAGDKITLKRGTLLYTDSEATTANKAEGGIYYLYDGANKNGRYAVTTKPEFVQNTPKAHYITGWVEEKHVAATPVTAVEEEQDGLD